MTDRLTAATKVIEEWIDRGYGNPEDNADSAARALDEAGLLAPDDDLKSARGALTSWWLNLDHKNDSRAPLVRSMIDMIDKHLGTADYMPSYSIEALETIVADHVEYGAGYCDPATGLRHVSWFEYKVDAQEELDHLRANPYNQSPRLVARRVSEPWEVHA